MSEGTGSRDAAKEPQQRPSGSVAFNPSTKRSAPANSPSSPAKKQSKWTAEEDAIIIDLRQKGRKWNDISEALPGRSPLSCRLHYQNYLERRPEWDEARKNQLSMIYERLKPQMWSELAGEMKIPWRAAEAMHWQLGEEDMARRAGTVPFSLSSSAVLGGGAGSRRVEMSPGAAGISTESHSPGSQGQ